LLLNSNYLNIYLNMADKEQTPAEVPKEEAEKKAADWAEMADEEEEDGDKEIIPAKEKKVKGPKRQKNAGGDYVVSKIEIPDQPAHKEITKIRPVSPLPASNHPCLAKGTRYPDRSRTLRRRAV
jgi:hypothetical protein